MRSAGKLIAMSIGRGRDGKSTESATSTPYQAALTKLCGMGSMIHFAPLNPEDQRLKNEKRIKFI